MCNYIPLIIALSLFSGYSMSQSNDIVINILQKSDSPRLINKALNFILGEGGVQKDSAAGMKWMRTAANLDNFYAQYYLGEVYNFGKLSGFQIDYMEAAKWYRKSIKHEEAYNPPNNPRDVFSSQAVVQARLIRKQKEFLTRRSSAQTRLGELYFRGLGVQKDYIEAEKLFRKAAQQGDSVAQLNLGIIYAQGNGVSKNYAIAKIWLQRAVKNGNMYAKSVLNDVENKMLNSSIAKGLAVAGAAILYSEINDRSSKSNGSLQSSQGSNAEYIRCYNQAIDRIAECRVVRQFGCSSSGCPDDKIECNKGWTGRSCESNSAGAYYINTFGLKIFYCDTKNRRNQDIDINVVIKKICSQK